MNVSNTMAVEIEHCLQHVASTNDTEMLTKYANDRMHANVVGITVPIIFSIVVVLGLLGNLLVISIVLVNKEMHTSTNVLITNLAVSDLCFIIFCVPITGYEMAMGTFPLQLPEVTCKLIRYVQECCAYGAVWTLVCLAVDRFLAVVFAIQSISWRQPRHAIKAIVILWIIILSIGSPNLVIVHLKEPTVSPPLCKVSRVCTLGFGGPLEQVLKYASFNLLGYLIPLVISSCLYFCMLRRLWQKSMAHSKSQEALRAKKKITKMIIGVTVVFAICWGPLNIVFLAGSILLAQGRVNINNVIILVTCMSTAQVLAYTNSCLNPILYSFLSENFRTGFWVLCRKVLPCKSVSIAKRQQSFEQTVVQKRSTTMSIFSMKSLRRLSTRRGKNKKSVNYLKNEREPLRKTSTCRPPQNGTPYDENIHYGYTADVIENNHSLKMSISEEVFSQLNIQCITDAVAL